MNRIPHISPMAIEHLLDRPIAFHRAFVGITGSVDAALFLSQAVYWSKRTRDADGWFYKSREEWHEETGLSRFEQESSRKKLRALGILHELKTGIPARLYYRVDFERLAQLLSEYAQREADKSREKPVSVPKNDQRDEENARSEAKTVTPTTMLVSDQHDGQFSTNKMASFSPPKLTETTTETTTERRGSLRENEIDCPPDPPPPLKDPIQQRRETHRNNLNLEETIFKTIGTDLTIKLREIQEISGRRGTAWFGWLREHVAPHMQRLGSDFPGAVAAAVRAFHGSSDPQRYGLQDFVKTLEAYTPSPKPKPSQDDQLAAILADI